MAAKNNEYEQMGLRAEGHLLRACHPCRLTSDDEEELRAPHHWSGLAEAQKLLLYTFFLAKV